MWKVVEARCKDCGETFHYSDTAYRSDVARGLSPPERCPTHRATNARLVRSVGAAYWDAPLETDPAKKCWGKFGLAKLVRHRPEPQERAYTGVPVDDPPEKFRRIAPVADALVRNLEDPNGKQVSIVVGPTGTGKSTWVPYRILRSRVGETARICVTQPRLVTLKREQDANDDKTTPGYIARELLGAPGVGAGQEVGFLFRGESTQHDRYTRLLFVTDGLLIKWLVSGEIARFGVVVIDEAHEQSRNMELIFALLRYKLPLYPRLRAVIASATVDIEKFQNFFGAGNPDRVFVAAPDEETSKTPHEIFDHPGDDLVEAGMELPESPEEVPAAIAQVVEAIRKRPGFTQLEEPRGHVLAFVPTIALVNKTLEQVRSLGIADIEVVPCHAQMSAEENALFRRGEDRAAKALKTGKPDPKQRVLVATNYAETSVTLSGLRYVIDSGYIMEPDWDPSTCSVSYETKRHSQAGCTQRKGRVGRTMPGEVFRLYTQEDLEQFSEAPSAAIARERLDGFFLEAKSAGVEDLSSFRWLGFEETGSTEITRAVENLRARGAVDEDGDVTRVGVELGGVESSSVDLARCMVDSDVFACSLEVATVLAFVGQAKSVFQRSDRGLLAYARWRRGCYDDVEFYLRLFHHWESQKSALRGKELKEWASAEGLEVAALEDIESSRERTLKQFERRTHTAMVLRENALGRLERVRLAIARAIPEWVFVRTDEDESRFRPAWSDECPFDGELSIDRDSACCALEGVEAFVSLSRRSIGEGEGRRTFATQVVRLRHEWIQSLQVETNLDAAMALRRGQETAEQDWGQEAAERITGAVPAADAIPEYGAGELVSFRAVRSEVKDDGGSRLILAQDVETGVECLVQLPGRAGLEAGAAFRAYARGRKDGRVQVDQVGLGEAEYSSGTAVEAARVVGSLKRDEDGSIHALLVELEHGVVVRLGERGIPFSEREKTLHLPAGSRLRVVCRKQGDKLELVLPEVYEAAAQEVSVDDSFVATLVRFDEKDGELRGAICEFLPGRAGYLPVSALGQRPYGQIRLKRLEVGAKMALRIAEVKAEEKFTLSREPAAVGAKFDGFVAKFWDPGSRRQGAFIDLGTGKKDGFLHHSALGRDGREKLGRLAVGDEIRVVVDKIEKGRISVRPLRLVESVLSLGGRG